MREADFDEAIRLDARLPPERRAGVRGWVEVIQRLRTMEPALAARELERAVREQPGDLDQAAQLAMLVFEDLPLARTIARAALRSTDAAVRRAAQQELVRIEQAAGRWRAAASHLSVLADGAPNPTLEHSLAGCALLPFLPLPAAELRAVRARVESWDSVVPGHADPYSAVALRPHTRSYYLAALSARLGEFDAAARHIEALGQAPEPEHWAEVADAFAASISAYVAFTRGDFEAVLRALETPSVRHTADLNIPANPLHFDTYLRAEALYQLGREAQAQPWFEHGFTWLAFESAYQAPRQLRLAQIHDRAGRRDRAAEHYARFLALWSDPEPELRAVTDQARARLEALRNDRVRQSESESESESEFES